MKFYKVTDSQGVTHTRSTRDRSYTHAVVSRWTCSWSGKPRVAAAWAGRLALAQKNAASGTNPSEIIPAVEIDGAEYRASKR